MVQHLAVCAMVLGSMLTPGLATAATVEGAVTGLPALRRCQALLDGGVAAVPCAQDGSFAFYDVPEGVHAVDIAVPGLVFRQYKVNVGEDGSVRAVEYPHPGAKHQPAVYPLRATPAAPAIYLTAKPQMSWLGMLMNPTVLIMGVMGVLMLCMSSASGSIDKEEMRRVQKEMGIKPGANPFEMLTGMLAGGEAGGGGGSAAAGQVADGEADGRRGAKGRKAGKGGKRKG